MKNFARVIIVNCELNLKFLIEKESEFQKLFQIKLTHLLFLASNFLSAWNLYLNKIL